MGAPAVQGAVPRRVHLWPDNLDAWCAWQALQTQWRTAGLAGVRTGLDYAACRAWLQDAGYSRKRRHVLLLDLHACELIALAEWHRLAQRKGARR